MAKTKIAIVPLLFLAQAACGLTAALLIILFALTGCQNNNPPPCTGPLSCYQGLQPPNSGWTAFGSGTGVNQQLSNPFIFPTESSGRTVNYVYTAPPHGLALGKTITVTYSVEGTAVFAPLPEDSCGAGGCGPAEMRLFIWGNTPDTANDRWWCAKPFPLVLGDNQTMSCVIDTTWTGTGLPGYNQATFPNSVANPFAVGFTFGGMFAGHGDWATSGTATFRIIGITVN